jgi:hypothetical protein
LQRKYNKKEEFSALNDRFEQYLSGLLLLESLDDMAHLREWLELSQAFPSCGIPVDWFSGLELIEEIRAKTEAHLRMSIAKQEQALSELNQRVQLLNVESQKQPFNCNCSILITNTANHNGSTNSTHSGSNHSGNPALLASDCSASPAIVSTRESHSEALHLIRAIEKTEFTLANLKHRLFQWYGFTHTDDSLYSVEGFRAIDKVEGLPLSQSYDDTRLTSHQQQQQANGDTYYEAVSCRPKRSLSLSTPSNQIAQNALSTATDTSIATPLLTPSRALALSSQPPIFVSSTPSMPLLAPKTATSKQQIAKPTTLPSTPPPPPPAITVSDAATQTSESTTTAATPKRTLVSRFKPKSSKRPLLTRNKVASHHHPSQVMAQRMSRIKSFSQLLSEESENLCQPQAG